MICYAVHAFHQSHIFEVVLKMAVSKQGEVLFRLPAWIPGSYMIRDFSRNLISLSAYCGHEEIAVSQRDKQTWSVTCGKGTLELRYQVYAFDLSVREAYLDQDRAFINGACLFLEPVGYGHESCELKILASAQMKEQGWQIATALAVGVEHDEDTLGVFIAENYAELIDSPIEAGNFSRVDFIAGNIPHSIVISGYFEGDLERLASDVQKICLSQIELFHGEAPFKSYLFLLHLSDDGAYGGLEHRASTALLASRKSLPSRNLSVLSDEYIQLLGLFSHEYFHAWNVKSIKPEVFTDYDLTQEVYTSQLWAFEGITSYYDELMLLRSGVIDKKQYLDLLAKSMTRVFRNSGRLKQTLSDSSFNAWTKFYKQNENASNAIVSYYQKGALLALGLDLLIRTETDHKKSLDDVMRGLYFNYAKKGIGIAEDSWADLIEEFTGVDVSTYLHCGLDTTEDLPLSELLSQHGIEMQIYSMSDSAKGGYSETAQTEIPVIFLGARWRMHEDRLCLTHVFDDGSFQDAGLSAGDEIIALNGFKSAQPEPFFSRMRIGDTVRVHYFREGFLKETVMTLKKGIPNTCFLKMVDLNKSIWLGTII